MAAIFISYRRDDSQSATGRLADDLAGRFGEDAVFRDLEAIDAGEDFTRAIEDGIRRASVMLVMIGRRWLDATDAAGGRRIDRDADYVRREIETALAARVPVIPVLVEGATMPGEGALPESIGRLARIQAHEINPGRWRDDSERLAARLWQDFEIEPVADRAPAVTGRLVSLRRYPFHLASLVLRPKRFLATRVHGRRGSAVDAFVFFCISTLAAVWLAIGEWPGKSWNLFLSGVSAGVVATLLLSIPLYLAWRAVGARPDYARIAAVLFYQVSVLHLGAGLGGLLLFMSANMTDPGLLLRLRESIDAGGALAVAPHLEAILEGSGWSVVGPYLGVLLLALCLWLVASWGAYRQTLGVSRLRSLAAFAVLVGLVLAIVALAGAALGGA